MLVRTDEPISVDKSMIEKEIKIFIILVDKFWGSIINERNSIPKIIT